MTDDACQDQPTLRQYSRWQTLWHNVPYAVMIALGAAVTARPFGAGGWIAAVGYVLYGLAGTLAFMLLICPHCIYHGTRSCPCGYGLLAARLRPRQLANRFAERFKRHVPLIVPLWLIPPAAGAIALIRDFDWTTTVLLAAFAADAFVLLPLVSTRHGCAECPQRADCPWMGRSTEGAGGAV